MTTRAIVFPFDLFGAGGSAIGAELIADELREMLRDNRHETQPTRARAYSPHVRIRQTSFEHVEHYHAWRARGRRLARRTLDEDDFTIWISGNHLGCLPLYDELSELPEPPLVVQLDAHLDVHNFSGYSTEPSHGNFLLHCAEPLPPIVNVGHREQLLMPDHIREFYRLEMPASAIDLDRLREEAAGATSVFIDLDCDVLDAAFFPAVARPVPFGLTPQQVLAVFEAVWSNKVRGVMISEFDPGRDVNDRSLALVMWLMEWVLLRHHEPPSLQDVP